MTSSHILFIPGVLMIGMFLGFILGARAARNQFDLERKREAEREAAREARAARRHEKQAERASAGLGKLADQPANPEAAPKSQ
jgi:hypothetical protein